MPRARTTFRETPQGAVYIYRLPGRWWSLAAWVWSLAGGLALGTAAAVALAAWGFTAETGGSGPGFAIVLAAGALIGLGLIYALAYGPAACGRRLSIAFDLAAGAITVNLPDAPQRTLHYAASEAVAFRLVDALPGRRVRCSLVLETVTGVDLLLALREPCAALPPDLPRLAERLNAELRTAQAASEDIPPLVIGSDGSGGSSAIYEPPPPYAPD
ncbi:MAG: hypothetical protein GXY36_19410 [Chloroflexi bacterium]|mgnify:CR=1 FL=1|nr:hypothetical protein [Chloroflexota bacterium]